jgi:APA family basic amino acid/polyamine antiporter
MVGSGILGTSGKTLQQTGSPLTLLTLWGVGGMMALAGALTVAELGTRLPKAGGDYVFVRAAFGSAVGFVFGWCNLLFTMAGPIAWISLLTVAYVAPDDFRSDGLVDETAATAVIATFTFLHCLGQRQSAWVQNITTLVKLGVFLAFAGLGFASGNGDLEHFSQGGSAIAKAGWVGLAVNLTYVLYAYSGWNGAAYLAGEIRDPKRNIPRSLIVGSLMVTALYLLLNALYVYAVPMTQIESSSPEEVTKIAALAGARLFGDEVSRVLSIVFGVGMLASISALLFTAPRIAFMMARDGLMPRFVGRLHPTGNAPAAATVLVGLLSTAIVWSGNSDQILDFTAVGLTAMSGLTVASVFPLRGRRDLPQGYRTPLFPLTPIFFLLLTAMIVVLTIRSSDTVAIDLLGRTWRLNMGQLSLASVFLGFPVYYAYIGLQRLVGARDVPRDESNDGDAERGN